MKKDFHENRFDEGTVAKLSIFRQYIREWIPVWLAKPDSKYKKVALYDFFSGPGYDGDGIAGSPLTMVQEVRNFCAHHSHSEATIPVHLVFNDIKSKHIETLRGAIEQDRCPKSCCRFTFTSMPFSESLEMHLDEMKDPVQANLVIMDQFGIKEVAPSLIKKLLDSNQTDVLFYISSSYIRRFGELEEIRRHFPNLDFEKIKNIEYKLIHKYICEYFEKELNDPSAWMVPFSIIKGSNIYGVIFATRHKLGVEKFLNVCWRIDPKEGVANYYVVSEKQHELLFDDITTSTRIDLFESDLLDFIRKNRPDNSRLYEFCLRKGFHSVKAGESLRRMQDDGRIQVRVLETSNPARRGSFYLKEKSPRVRFSGGSRAS